MSTYLEDIRNKVIKKSRFDKIDYMVDAPEPEEIDAAIYFAIDEINSYPPMTNYTLDDFQNTLDPRYRLILINCASKQVIDTLVFDWVANGLDAEVGPFALSSKLGDYQSLYDRLAAECKETMERVKPAENRKASVLHFTNLGKNANVTGSNTACRYSNASRRR